MDNVQFIDGIRLPVGDTHFKSFLLNGQYQQQHRDCATSYCKSFRTAVDVGAHVGLWSRELEKKFDRVVAFEPIAENVQCLAENTTETDIFPYALGNGNGSAELRQIVPGNSGTWSVVDWRCSSRSAISKTLDSMSFDCVDFLKIDAECSELAILQGATETIVRCRPVVCVELRDEDTLRQVSFPIRYRVDEVVSLMSGLGMSVAAVVSCDYVFVWVGV